MRRTYLGEFEEVVVLLVTILGAQAYWVTVSEEFEQQTSRQVTLGRVHTTLIQLEEKGFATSELGGATQERGGRRKRLFAITAAGLVEAQQATAQPALEVRSLARPSTCRCMPNPPGWAKRLLA